MTTRRNHYVPVWYQKAFVSGAPPHLYYLDLAPEKSPPSGRSGDARAPRRSAPKQCFWSEDLYTTEYFGAPNDKIERFLFGAIDNDGAVAVRAVAEGNPRAVHESFHAFFSYIDAQKIRTPKGLDWIRARYGKIDQLNLMVEMHALRLMHCTMWSEAVREVVSADDSEVKFIVTDHPVTVYNAHCSPDSVQCRYPEDPPIELIGSQTIFPLAANHCLILTNLEYAKNPTGVDLIRVRQNPRHFGHTLARTDAWIRTRKLSRDQVIAINYILKSRARRFIAAAEADWLYPERANPTDWRAAGQILLPPEEGLWHFGGEIYVGYKDGSTSYQDAFGRTSPSPAYLRKAPSADESTSDQTCRCGSGKSFQACCKDLPPEDQMPSDVYSIRERNLMFVRAIESVLGLNGGKTWEDVRRELSDEHVKEIHTTYAALWPKDTNIVDLLPRPDERAFRALYVGLIDPRTIVASVIAWLRYFDEILVLNPFVNAACTRREFSPIESPGQYKEQTIKNVALLMTLAPFIRAGSVHFVPDPIELNDSLRQEVWALAQERREMIKLDPADLELGYELGRDDMKRMLARLPDDALRGHIRQSSPDLSEETLTEVMTHLRKEHAADPLALIQPLVTGEGTGQLLTMRGVNFELALFLAQLTGAVIYSDQRLTRNHLAAAHLPVAEGSVMTDRVLPLTLSLEIDPYKSEADRSEQSAQAFRATLRQLWSATLAPEDSSRRPAIDAALIDVGSAAASMQVRRESADVAGDRGLQNTLFEIDADLVVPPNGYGLTAVRRFLVAFGRRRHTEVVPFTVLFGRAVAGATETGARSKAR